MTATDSRIPHQAPVKRAIRTATHSAGGIALFPENTTRSRRFRHALSRIELFSRYDGVTVVIEGECGTGKTYFARYLHKGSSRSDRSFYHVNIAALDDALVSSELFGHVSGAFTGADRARPGLFASAHGGTLFLDEIAKATTQVQCRLLSVVERRAIRPVGADREVPVDVRLVAASNVSLRRLTSDGEFLPDLLDRLGHFRVEIPPLRDRRADIPGLVENFVAAHAPAFGYDPLRNNIEHLPVGQSHIFTFTVAKRRVTSATSAREDKSRTGA